MSAVSDKIHQITGKFPLVWGGEWGFSDDRHDTDNVKYRPHLLDQIRENHKAGRIICITYHQASPTVGEPCDFQGGVICKITDADWDAILKEGTPLNKVWADHVDRLAMALKTLRDEHIPIIFRPYHEMNGAWFWWGGKPDRFKALWNLTYDRFVHRHKLNNLLWAWTCDRPWPGVETYYPGHSTVDLLGTDIYPAEDRKETYPTEWYNRMQRLAEGRPIGLSEISELPTPELLKSHKYAWFMCWDGMVFASNSTTKIKEVFASPAVLSVRK